VDETDRVFIKMDIEGGEYEILSGLGDYYQRVTGLVIEFHFAILLRDRMETHLSQLRQQFDIVHIHVNNYKGVDEEGMPDVIEITLENKNLRNGSDKESEKMYPLEGLDYPNSYHLADYILLFDRERLKSQNY